MLIFDPHRWIAENCATEPARSAHTDQTLASLATLAGAKAENEKSKSGGAAAKVAKAAKVAPLPAGQAASCDLSAYDVRDDDDGWIGE